MKIMSIESLLDQEMLEVKGGTAGTCSCTTGAHQSDSAGGKCICKSAAQQIDTSKDSGPDPSDVCNCTSGALQ
jgi:hypothetical protein